MAERLPDGEDNSKGATKYDGDKVDIVAMLLEQVPDALEQVAWRFTAGAGKYSKGGWKNVPRALERYPAALGRHQIKLAKGEALDFDPALAIHLPESVELTHDDAIAWNALVVLQLRIEERRKCQTTAKPSETQSPSISKRSVLPNLRKLGPGSIPSTPQPKLSASLMAKMGCAQGFGWVAVATLLAALVLYLTT